MPPNPLTRLLRAELLVSGDRGRMARSAGTTAALLVASTCVSFGSSLLYARVLGPHGFGLYAYVTAWTMILTIPAALGTPGYLVREGAGRPEANRGLRRWADRRVLLVGGTLALVLASIFWVPIAGRTRLLFLIAAPIPMLAALGQVRQSLLRALNRVVSSQWPLALGPLLMVLTMLSIWLWRGTLLPWEVMCAALAANLLILLIGQYQLQRAVRNPQRALEPSPRLRAALPFMLMGVLFLINNRADIIFLGTMRGPHDAGLYAIAARAGAFVTFFAGAVNMVIGPRVAALYRSGDRPKLQRLLTGSARRVVVLTLPIAILFIAAANPLLALLYGPDYVAAAWPLRILTLGYLCIVVSGSTGLVANMSGHEKLTLYSVGIGVFLNILLNLVLIPPLGMNGAAIATSTSLAVVNALQWYWVRRRIGLTPSAFGI